MADTYTKLFSSITESTVWGEPYSTRIVWVAMLAMADSRGNVYGSVPGLARRANVSLDETENALSSFLAPDPYSRTKDEDGRRIEEIDGGWRLINHGKYAAVRDAQERAEYKRKWDRENRGDRPNARYRDEITPDTPPTKSDKVRQIPTPPTPLTPTPDKSIKSPNGDLSPALPEDAEQRDGEQPNGRPPCPHLRIIALYHETLPELRQVREWNETRRRLLQRRWTEQPERQDLDWWRDYFGYVRKSRFLMGQTTGRGGRSFDCDLEWLIRPTNMVKVLEGKYEDEAA